MLFDNALARLGKLMKQIKWLTKKFCTLLKYLNLLNSKLIINTSIF